jgi:tetratricopeptide (TPR) repeat protein
MTEILTPQQLSSEGESAYRRGLYPVAAQAFQAAAQGFASQGESLMAAEMANNASVALLKAGDAQGALQAVEGTQAEFARAGDLRCQGMAAGNRGAALEALGQLEEAAAAYQQSADLLKEAGEMELRAFVMQSLSALQLRMGQHLQAYGTMYAGVQGIQKPNPRQKLLKKLMEIPFKFLTGP